MQEKYLGWIINPDFQTDYGSDQIIKAGSGSDKTPESYTEANRQIRQMKKDEETERQTGTQIQS